MNQEKNIATLLEDMSFLNWISQKKDAQTTYWDKWYQASNANKILADDAKLILQGIPFKNKEVSQEKIQKNWQALSKKFNNTSAKSPKNTWLKIAASIVFLLGLFFVTQFYHPSSRTIIIQTGYDEHKIIELPEGSKIILSSNSELSYPDNIHKVKEPTVHLKGEAFFEITKKDEYPFKVILKDLAVEVLGTKFNINTHRPSSIISLVEGSVSLKHETQNIILKPNQTAFLDKNRQFDISNKSTQYWSSWIHNKWSFGNATLVKEVLQRIEENYGLQCQINAPDILENEISGEVSIDSKETLFESLAFLLDLNVYQDGEYLVFSPNSSN